MELRDISSLLLALLLPFMSTFGTSAAYRVDEVTPFEFHTARVTSTRDGGKMVTVDYHCPVTPLVGIRPSGAHAVLDMARVTQGPSSISVNVTPRENFPHLVFRLPDITYILTLDLTAFPQIREEQLPNIYASVQPPGNEVAYPTGSDAVFRVVTRVRAPDPDKVERSSSQELSHFTYLDVRRTSGRTFTAVMKSVGQPGASSSGSGLVLDSVQRRNVRGNLFDFRLKNQGGDPQAVLTFADYVTYGFDKPSLFGELTVIVFIPVHPSSVSSVFPPGAVSFVQGNLPTVFCWDGRSCSIACWVVGDNPGVVRLWRVMDPQDGGGVTLVGSREETYQGLVGFSTFVLHNVSKADAGDYVCVVQGSDGREVRRNVALVVE